MMLIIGGTLLYITIGAASVTLMAYCRDDFFPDEAAAFLTALLWPVTWFFIGLYHAFAVLPRRMEALGRQHRAERAHRQLLEREQQRDIERELERSLQ